MHQITKQPLYFNNADIVETPNKLHGFISKIHPNNQYDIVGPNRLWSLQKLQQKNLKLIQENTTTITDLLINTKVIKKSFVRAPNISNTDIGIVKKISKIIVVQFPKTIAEFHPWALLPIIFYPIEITEENETQTVSELYSKGSPGNYYQFGSINPQYFKFHTNETCHAILKIYLNESPTNRNII